MKLKIQQHNDNEAGVWKGFPGRKKEDDADRLQMEVPLRIPLQS